MHHAHLSLGEDGHLIIDEMHAMGGGHRHVEQPELVHEGDGRQAMLAHAFAHLAHRFGKVGLDADIQFRRRGDDALHHRLRHGIRRMRTEERGDTRMAFRDEALHLRDRLLEHRFRVRHDADDHSGQAGANAAFAHGIGHRVGEPVHIAEGRHAGAQHLGNTEQRRPVDILRRQPGFHRPDFFPQPTHQRQVIGGAAEERHPQVRMRIDEPGDGHHAARIQHLVPLAHGWRILLRANINNARIGNDHCSVLDEGEIVIHGDDGGVLYVQIRHFRQVLCLYNYPE